MNWRISELSPLPGKSVCLYSQFSLNLSSPQASILLPTLLHGADKLTSYFTKKIMHCQIRTTTTFQKSALQTYLHLHPSCPPSLLSQQCHPCERPVLPLPLIPILFQLLRNFMLAVVLPLYSNFSLSLWCLYH